MGTRGYRRNVRTVISSPIASTHFERLVQRYGDEVRNGEEVRWKLRHDTVQIYKQTIYTHVDIEARARVITLGRRSGHHPLAAHP